MEQELRKLEDIIEKAKVQNAFCAEELKKMESIIVEVEEAAKAVRNRSISNGTGNIT